MRLKLSESVVPGIYTCSQKHFLFFFLVLLCTAPYLPVSIFKIIYLTCKTKLIWLLFFLFFLLLYLFHFFESTGLCSAPRAPVRYPWQDVTTMSHLDHLEQQRNLCGVSQSFHGTGVFCFWYRRGFFQKSLASWANMDLLNGPSLGISIKFKHYLSPYWGLC